MPNRWILVHDCRTTPDGDRRAAETTKRPISQWESEALIAGNQARRVYHNDDGRQFSCDCHRRISRPDAENLIARGRAVWKLRWVGHDRPPVKERSQLILLRIAYPTKAYLLTHRDIENYGFQKQEHERIAAFAPRRS